jgi:hypothetical protein
MEAIAATLVVLPTLLGARAAPAFECANIQLSSSKVICSDPELMRLADERQEAINEARARIGEEAWPALWEDQKAWVRSYSTACGVRPDRSPPMPVPASITECFKRAAEARMAYIRAYGLVGGTSPAPSNTIPGSRTILAPGPTRPQFAPCADADWGCFSARLGEDMTEREVTNTIGYRPNKVEMETCGSQTPRPWACKVYTFGGFYSRLTVFFHRDDDGTWIVNNWSVSP